ncbi:hypothetical protein [Streptacidiphilus cavernicola]|uniref:Uncharacterized protein n=1 Tax=Streptacidiphilus cavernicola TaxID=3342716 RepID=A0ABV6VNW2_9ACTN
MAAPTDLLTDLHKHVLAYGLPDPERRRVENLISEVLCDAYEKSAIELHEGDFRELLPVALGQTLVQILAPMADTPHASIELEFSRYVLDALSARLSA